MLVISYGAQGETLRTFSTVLEEIWIGFDDRCHLQLAADYCAPIHCTLRLDEERRWVVIPHAPMQVNGTSITAPVFVTATDSIAIGACMLQIQPAKHEPSEQALIEGARADLAGRSVYADWLEERGQWDRAEFLRLTIAAADQKPGDPEFARTAMRIQKLAGCLDLQWRVQIAAADVEGCTLRREFTCNMTWDQLGTTSDPFVRSCGACKNTVHYCRTASEASQHAAAGNCIVLDLSIDRAFVKNPRPPSAPAPFIPMNPGMYLPPSYVQSPEHECPSCNGIVPAGYRFCPHCGARP